MSIVAYNILYTLTSCKVNLKVLVLNINNYPFGHYDYSRKGERIVAQGLQSEFLSLSEVIGFLFATK